MPVKSHCQIDAEKASFSRHMIQHYISFSFFNRMCLVINSVKIRNILR